MWRKRRSRRNKKKTKKKGNAMPRTRKIRRPKSNKNPNP